jgi:muconolactone delta-isomerase
MLFFFHITMTVLTPDEMPIEEIWKKLHTNSEQNGK